MGRKSFEAVVVVLVLLLAFSACKKDKPDATTKAPIASVGNSVYVVCEGSLGSGNAELSLYDRSANEAYEDVYKSANGQDLGDVFQSMELVGNKYFLCVNNSDKIVVLDTATRKQVATISVPKPRYILSVGTNKAYVSTLFSNKVYIIDPETYSVTGTIAMPFQNPEGMLLNNNKAYICTWDTACRSIYTINTTTDKIEHEMPIAGAAPQNVLSDANGKLWVLSGNITKGKQSALTCIDPSNNSIIKSFAFSGKSDAIRPVFNNAKDQLYFIEVDYNGGTANNGIYRFGISDAALPSTPFVAAKQYQYFWALGIEPVTDRIYVGDPKGFTQRGSVYIYDANGQQLNQFNVGVGPGHFYFAK